MWRRDSQQTRDLSRLLSVRSMNGKNV
jgi:hypothetical protein